MISLENTSYLSLTLLVPVFIALWFVFRYRENKKVNSIGDKSLIYSITKRTPRYIQFAKFFLIITSSLLLIIALCEPYISSSLVKVKDSSSTDVVFLIDVSKSMYAKDIAPNRLRRGQRLIDEIVKDFTKEQIGMVVFAGKAGAYVPLTDDYIYFRNALKSVSGKLIGQPGTSLEEALKISGLLFDRTAKRNKVLCIISDGEFHDKKAFVAADKLRKANIKIIALGIGTLKGAPVPADFEDSGINQNTTNGTPIISRLHQRELLRITGNNNLNYIEVVSRPNASIAFNKRLAELETVSYSNIHKPLFDLFMLLAIILLLVEICIPNVLERRNK